MVNALFVSAVLGPNNTPQRTAPQPPTQIYTASPVFQPTKGPAPTYQIHGTTVQLGINESRVETLTLWHNPAAEPVEGKLLFTVYSHGYGFSELRRLKATWNKQPVEFRAENVEQTTPDLRNLNLAHSQKITASVTASFPAKGTGALRMDFIQPNAKVGFTKDERQWTLVLPNLEARPEQYRIAIKYSPQVVWRPIAGKSPRGRWEIGENGAYLKLDNMLINGGTATYTFYPKTN